MTKNQALFLAVFLLLITGGFFLFRNQRLTLSKIDNKKNLAPVNNQLVNGQPIKEMTIIAKKWQFDPKEIRVKQGERLKLRVKSVDVDHGFALSAFGIDQTISAGKETVIEFVADRKGEFPFFCSVYCGEGHSGMRGKLVVE